MLILNCLLLRGCDDNFLIMIQVLKWGHVFELILHLGWEYGVGRNMGFLPEYGVGRNLGFLPEYGVVVVAHLVFFNTI